VSGAPIGLPRKPTFRLHHVGIVVPDLAPAIREYVDRFGFLVESEPIADPAQTATVCFLREPEARHWTELVSPIGAASKLHGALRHGAGTNHLCYEVESVIEAGAHLRDHGMLALGAPTPAVAFDGRVIAWYMDRSKLLVELVEAGPGALSLSRLRASDA